MTLVSKRKDGFFRLDTITLVQSSHDLVTSISSSICSAAPIRPGDL